MTLVERIHDVGDGLIILARRGIAQWVVVVSTAEPGEIGTESTRHFVTGWGARRHVRFLLSGLM